MMPEIGYVVAVLFLGSLVRSTFGFGDALVAMPLLTLLIPIRVATPLVAVASAGPSSSCCHQWDSIVWSSVAGSSL